MQSLMDPSVAAREAVDAALHDSQLRRLMADRGAAASSRLAPSELLSYRLEAGTDDDDDKDNCGSQCGCNQHKGIGCGDETHGQNDDGGDCPYHKG